MMHDVIYGGNEIRLGGKPAVPWILELFCVDADTDDADAGTDNADADADADDADHTDVETRARAVQSRHLRRTTRINLPPYNPS